MMIGARRLGVEATLDCAKSPSRATPRLRAALEHPKPPRASVQRPDARRQHQRERCDEDQESKRIELEAAHSASVGTRGPRFKTTGTVGDHFVVSA